MKVGDSYEELVDKDINFIMSISRYCDKKSRFFNELRMSVYIYMVLLPCILIMLNLFVLILWLSIKIGLIPFTLCIINFVGLLLQVFFQIKSNNYRTVRLIADEIIHERSHRT